MLAQNGASGIHDLLKSATEVKVVARHFGGTRVVYGARVACRQSAEGLLRLALAETGSQGGCTAKTGHESARGARVSARESTAKVLSKALGVVLVWVVAAGRERQLLRLSRAAAAKGRIRSRGIGPFASCIGDGGSIVGRLVLDGRARDEALSRAHDVEAELLSCLCELDGSERVLGTESCDGSRSRVTGTRGIRVMLLLASSVPVACACGGTGSRAVGRGGSGRRRKVKGRSCAGGRAAVSDIRSRILVAAAWALFRYRKGQAGCALQSCLAPLGRGPGQPLDGGSRNALILEVTQVLFLFARASDFCDAVVGPLAAAKGARHECLDTRREAGPHAAKAAGEGVLLVAMLRLRVARLLLCRWRRGARPFFSSIVDGRLYGVCRWRAL